jgi:hypothetical protein
MDRYKSLSSKNTVKDYNVVQGTSHPSDLMVYPHRDYNFRYVTVENSSKDSNIGVCISESFDLFSRDGSEINTNPSFYLSPGGQRHLSINSIGERMQYIHLIDTVTSLHVGSPHPFITSANSFVLREGMNGWFVQDYYRPSYRASY